MATSFNCISNKFRLSEKKTDLKEKYDIDYIQVLYLS